MGENAELYHRACGVVARALEIAECERDAFIERACEGDAVLRREVDWLYGECQRTVDSVLGDNVIAPGLPGSESPPSDLRVAAPREYSILRELGRGGMGIVYLAERRDAEYHQLVALKLLTMAAAFVPEAVTRFMAERQILAELSHPHIAHLVDGGRLPDGRPFIAMEYVDGERIDVYCAQRALPIEAKLRLFQQVCAAVHYAHQHLVIHRDIKPANIFVTADGQPKLLDFGIARLIEQKAHIVSAQTLEGHAPLTLAYASPEQIDGKVLTTGTDIYSLGMLLYELLSGAHAYPRDMAALEMARRIREQDPLPPSRALQDQRSAAASSATSLHWWRRANAVSGDLDAIVLKAIRKAAQDRYQTAAELADDIGNYLAGRPVAARRGEGWYRARKVLHRYRYAALALIVAVIAFAAYTLQRQHQLAQTVRERDKARQLLSLMTDIFHAPDPDVAQGKEFTLREILRRGEQSIEANDTLPEDVRAELEIDLAETYTSLAWYEDATRLASAAIARLQPLAAREDQVLYGRALFARASVIAERGEFKAAYQDFQKAIEVLSAQGEPGEQFKLGAQSGLAWTRLQAEDPSEELASFFRSIRDEAVANHLQSIAADASFGYSGVLKNLGRMDESQAASADALQRFRLAGRQNTTGYIKALADAGQTAAVREDYQTAIALLQEVTTAWQRIAPENKSEQAVAWSDLSYALWRNKQAAEGLDAARNAVALIGQSNSGNNARYQAIRLSYATKLAAVGKSDEAIEQCRTAIEILRKSPDESITRNNILRARLVLMNAQLRSGRIEDAADTERLLEDKLQQPQVADPEGNYRWFVQLRAQWHLQRGEIDLAAADAKAAFDLWPEKARSEGLWFACVETFARVALARNSLTQLKDLLAQASPQATALLGECHQIAIGLSKLSAQAQGDPAAAHAPQGCPQ